MLGLGHMLPEHSRTKRLGLETESLLAVQFRASQFSSLGLDFFLCKMEVMALYRAGEKHVIAHVKYETLPAME